MRFTFNQLPTNVSELQNISEATLDTPFKTAALTMLALCQYEKDSAATIEMLNFLKGPENVSEYEKQFIKERLKDKQYKVLSFFDGATPENGYTPSVPYTIEVTDNPYSYPDDNWATMFVKSSGA